MKATEHELGVRVVDFSLMWFFYLSRNHCIRNSFPTQMSWIWSESRNERCSSSSLQWKEPRILIDHAMVPFGQRQFSVQSISIKESNGRQRPFPTTRSKKPISLIVTSGSMSFQRFASFLVYCGDETAAAQPSGIKMKGESNSVIHD